MKKQLIAILAFTVLAGTVFAQVDRSKRPEAGPPPKLTLGQSEKFTLDNGLRVFFVEDHRVPSVVYSLSLADRDPILEGEKAGYVSLSGSLMRRGTKNRAKDDIDKDLDYIGAQFSCSSGSMFGRSVTKFQDKLLDIMSDVLLNPTFSQEELDKLRKQYKSNIARSRPNPNAMISRMKSNVLYGKDHPYGERMTEFTLDKVTVADCKAYHQTYWRPNVAYLVIIGDLTLEQAKANAKKYFGAWEKADVPKHDVKIPPPIDKGFVGFVNKDNAKQSVISIANTTDYKPYSEDYAKGTIMNSILGGSGFNARLYQNIREDKGYTYGAYSSLRSNEFVGEFNCGASVRNEVTDSALTEFMYEIKRIRAEEVSDEELRMAKNIVAGGFALSLESPGQAASFATVVERYGLQDDYFENYIKRMQSVTKEEVQDAAKKYIQPKKMVFAVAGSEEEVREDLEAWAKKNELEFKRFDSEDGEEIVPVDPSIPEGMTAQKVVDRYIKEIGGVDKIKQIKTLIINASNYASGAEIELNEIRVMPGKMATSMMREGDMVYQKIYNRVAGKGFYNYQDRDKKAFRTQLYDASLELAKESQCCLMKCISKHSTTKSSSIRRLKKSKMKFAT